MGGLWPETEREQAAAWGGGWWRPSPTAEAETEPTQPARKPKSQDPGEADCILFAPPVDCISQNTHFRLPSEFYTRPNFKPWVVGGSGAGWGYWPGILEAAFWLPGKHPATKTPFLQLLFFNRAILVTGEYGFSFPLIIVVLQRGADRCCRH